jgi:hypothetical protein
MPLIDAADEVTVSNVALQERFGGVIVPHADERVRSSVVRPFPKRDASA